MKRRVLITGGAGMVGSRCAERFSIGRDKIIVLDNLMRSSMFGYSKASVEHNWRFLGKFKNITRVKGDVRSVRDVKKAIGKGVDLVIHTAGQPGVPSSVRAPVIDFNINAFGTLNVLEQTRSISPKATFIYCSTNKVYGENVDKIPLVELPTRYAYSGVTGVNETMPVDNTGHTPYGASKLTGDLYVQEYGRLYNMRTGVFRMSCIYGPRQFGFEDQGWVAWFIIAKLFKKPITIFGDGKQVRDMLFVNDLVRAFNLFDYCGKQGSSVYNIGGGVGNTMSLREFVTQLDLNVDYADWRPSDQKVYVTDISKVKKELGWKPAISTSEGIRRLQEWIKANGRFWSA